jgi:uncharacterized tellurite resistance protein B-like protein
MNLTGFTDQQKQSLVDLLVLGMYADGHLDLIEDEIARQVLDSIQFSSDSARQYFLDASFARARKHGASPKTTRSYVSEIAKSFPTPAMRREVRDALEESLTSDHNLADKEKELLAVIAEEFKL